ncbi:MAG: ATP-binding protein [Defluviitaleaceae bacterium]|nr:ATP-binding protein [Defluviitaleaceae bacterium]
MFLLQMSGQPGSGKSILSKKIGEKTGAVVIDNDIIKSAILELAINEISGDIAGKLTYNINFRLAENYVRQNKSVIIDTPCRFQFIIERGKKICAEYGAKYKYIECRISNYEETEKRLKQRNKLPSQVDESAVVKENYGEWLGQAIFPEDEYITVETDQPIENYLEKCLRYVNS